MARIIAGANKNGPLLREGNYNDTILYLVLLPLTIDSKGGK